MQARPITLLVGFDAMRWLIEKRWVDGGRASANLATLLSSLNRSGGPPLDIALWWEWVAAVATVRLDIVELPDALQATWQSHREWRAADDQPQNKRRAALDRLRAKRSSDPWHRVGDREIRSLDALLSVGPFLSSYWASAQDPDLKALIDWADDVGTQGAPEWDQAVTAAQRLH